MPIRDTGTSPVALSPLLEWALGTEVGDVNRVHALHFSARAYRELAQSRTSQWRAWLPILAGAIFGGVLVLIFGLSLFTPMIELLTSLTKP